MTKVIKIENMLYWLNNLYANALESFDKEDQQTIENVIDEGAQLIVDELKKGEVMKGTDAEARLIASAPKLLAVVERLQEWAESKTSDWFDDLEANNVHQAPNLSEIIQAANEAVSEAKGGE